MACARIALLLALCTPLSATRVNTVVFDAASVECGPDSCDGFGASAACSCDGMDEGALVERAERVLFGMLQSLRYVSDYQLTAGALQKLWFPTRMSHARLFNTALGDLIFLQGAAARLPRVAEIASAPVEELLRNGSSAAPAGALPAVVEVWDSRALKNEFVGEAGAPLAVGSRRYTLPLRASAARGGDSLKLAEAGQALGEVTFDTVVSLAPCARAEVAGCVGVSLDLTCRAARALPSKVSNPYCKVRVKSDPHSPSSKDKTPALKRGRPTWTQGNFFEYLWEAQATPGNESAPVVLEKLSLLEQALSHLRLVVESSLLNGKECGEEGLSKTQRRGCRILASLQSLEVDRALVDEALAESDNEELSRALRKMMQESGGIAQSGSLLQRSDWGILATAAVGAASVAVGFVGICIVEVAVVMLLIK